MKDRTTSIRVASELSSEGSYDLIGVGAGPSNLSLAALLHAEAGVRMSFFEKQPTYSWHQGLLIQGAALQISYLKDLVTPIDPTNPYSFLNYLKRCGRFYNFLNATGEKALRHEFSAYLRWAAESLPTVQQGVEVHRIRFNGNFIVETSCGTKASKCLSIAIGARPFMPDFARARRGARVFHSSEFLNRQAEVGKPEDGETVAVIGGGQSGAEVLLALLSQPQPPANIVWVTRRNGFPPLDETPFSNEMFGPHYSNHFYSLPENRRMEELREHKFVSDGISTETLRLLYQKLYLNRYFSPRPVKISIYSASSATSIDELGHEKFRLGLERHDIHDRVCLDCSRIIFCTGYSTSLPEVVADLLRGTHDNDCYTVLSDYSLEWDGPQQNKIFLMNAAARARGIADPNLSLIAWRSAVVANSFLGRPVYDLSCDPPFRDFPGIIDSTLNIRMTAGA